jgi:hypothetical protein
MTALSPGQSPPPVTTPILGVMRMSSGSSKMATPEPRSSLAVLVSFRVGWSERGDFQIHPVIDFEQF